jgi:antitoxin VapB
MDRIQLSRIGDFQIVRLAGVSAFPPGVRELVVSHDGPRRVLTPVDATWDDFFDAPGTDLGPREEPDCA